MNHKELKALIKSTEKQCYLRYKNGKHEVLKEVYKDHASESIQGVIIGADDGTRIGREINVALENLVVLPKSAKKEVDT